mmetsp:Transcript_6044/g.8622  ORF Transcript_6044/g.8622 Transcript_6044/m.8622 type:complete len:200 (-) Transcript_6044:107-706(-)
MLAITSICAPTFQLLHQNGNLSPCSTFAPELHPSIHPLSRRRFRIRLLDPDLLHNSLQDLRWQPSLLVGSLGPPAVPVARIGATGVAWLFVAEVDFVAWATLKIPSSTVGLQFRVVGRLHNTLIQDLLCSASDLQGNTAVRSREFCYHQSRLGLIIDVHDEISDLEYVAHASSIPGLARGLQSHIGVMCHRAWLYVQHH